MILFTLVLENARELTVIEKDQCWPKGRMEGITRDPRILRG